MAERLKAAVLKTARARALVGSNPTLSANSSRHASFCGSVASSLRAPDGAGRNRFKATLGCAEIEGEEKRRQKRSRHRLTCDLVVDGKSHAGIVIDHSPTGTFVQTRPRPGLDSVVEVVLRRDDSEAEIRCEAGVARARITPTLLQRSAPGGVGLELIDPPVELFELLNDGAAPSEGDDRAGESGSGAAVAKTFRVRVRRARPPELQGHHSALRERPGGTRAGAAPGGRRLAGGGYPAALIAPARRARPLTRPTGGPASGGDEPPLRWLRPARAAAILRRPGEVAERLKALPC